MLNVDEVRSEIKAGKSLQFRWNNAMKNVYFMDLFDPDKEFGMSNCQTIKNIEFFDKLMNDIHNSNMDIIISRLCK